MIERIARKMRGEEQGFTLIELMVVVLIIGILVAIALPAFLGARARADRRAAQTDLRNAVAASKTYFTDADTYTGFDATDGEAIEPSLEWTSPGAAVADNTNVHVYDVTSTGVVMVRWSRDGQFFGLSDENGTTFYCQAAAVASIDTQAECNATAWT